MSWTFTSHELEALQRDVVNGPFSKGFCRDQQYINFELVHPANDCVALNIYGERITACLNYCKGIPTDELSK